MVSFTPLPLYSQVKSPQYLFDRKLGVPYSWSGNYGKEINLALPGIEPGSSNP
jgi:hypothetical protein